MDVRARRRDDSHMPLDLTDEELVTAATACRAMAYQEGERAKQMENPTTRGPGSLSLFRRNPKDGIP
jgi:hypothetical protein